MGTEKMECKNMLKYTSRVHENHFNNPIKLIVHLLICFGNDFTLALGTGFLKHRSGYEPLNLVENGSFLNSQNFDATDLRLNPKVKLKPTGAVKK